jgi:hypothetical protein
MSIYRLLADLIVTVHLAYVLIVVFGLAAIVLGIVLRWNWTRNFWFRAIHLLMIGAVVVETFFGIRCPLTTWEEDLRTLAGEDIEQASFVARLAENVLFIQETSEADMGVYYYVFGAVVALTLAIAPPRRPAWPRRRSRLKEPTASPPDDAARTPDRVGPGGPTSP